MAETSDTPSETLREWARDDRVTLAIVFTDIVGSTALGRALGDEQMNGVRRAHFGQSRALLAQHAGREIKTIGDSVMARTISRSPASIRRAISTSPSRVRSDTLPILRK